MTATIFTCRRSTDRLVCTTAGCNNYATGTCSFELQGKATGKTCKRAVCGSCAPNGLCPPHRRLEAARKTV